MLPEHYNHLKDLNKLRRNEAIKKLHSIYSVAEDKNTRIKILEKLNELKDNTHYEQVENYFISEEDLDVKMEAAKLLAFNYNKVKAKAVKPLIWVLENEKRNEIKHIALRLLVPLAYRSEYRTFIVESLKRILESKNDPLKIEAAEALGFLKEDSVANDLVEMLKSSNKQMRISAIEALNNLNIFPKKAVPLLLDNLELGSYDVWRFAYNTLRKKLSRNNFTNKLLNILEDTEKNDKDIKIGYKRRGIIKALGEIGNKKAIPLLINSLKDWHDWVREEALNALDKIDPNWKIQNQSLLKEKNIKFTL